MLQSAAVELVDATRAYSFGYQSSSSSSSHKAVAQVTPAHTDPHHNLLAQVVGRKYVRLYAPPDLPRLYPFTSGLTTNTSQVLLQPAGDLRMLRSVPAPCPAAPSIKPDKAWSAIASVASQRWLARGSPLKVSS